MTTPLRRVVDPLTEFLRTEAATGVVLLGATVAALVWANVGTTYSSFWATDVFGHGLGDWVDDGLMTVFFFVVALEIKREFVEGELRDRRRALTPVGAAIGGMIVPALIYLAINAGSDTARGWGIPIATDIAFAIGVLALLGSRVAPGLRLFLLTLAIVDDLGAIVVIALVYSTTIDVAWLAEAVALVVIVLVMRRFAVSPWWYVVPAIALWFGVYESGVHATIAGVALGLLTPVHARTGAPVLDRLERTLHPWVGFVVVPLFALANAGVAIGGGAVREAFTAPLTWGVVIGLVIGKPIGVLVGTGVARAAGGVLAAGVTGRQLVGGAVLAGIGFTVSLFVTNLAFDDPATLADARIAVMGASLVAGAAGALVLARPTPR